MMTYSSTRFRSTRLGAPCLAAALLFTPGAQAKDKPRTAPVPKPAGQYPAFDRHETEKVTVAAEPCSDPEKCKFFRLEYVQHGFVPVWVIITNDRDQALTLDEVRIQYLPSEGDKIPAATDEDLNRRLFQGKNAIDKRLPIIPIPIKHTPVDQKITADDNDFGFKSLVVAPHTTAAGYLFYDVRGVDDPVLKHAELYLRKILTTDAKGDKVELFGFTIPFDKWLAVQSKKSDSEKKESR
ncbi:hypothetical protein SAMN05421770_10432 [Granulicella rosea]|uniref:Uncharacterized protein n=1 Tax=Granulicella rosea TaxID=474952 RepID=A0A239JNA4_9BACT|nr:hypothetical protein [Granulicella rosea]SNT07032.1 hypothetical protein SAMN05421770_10432 [Granulicella rosea]